MRIVWMICAMLITMQTTALANSYVYCEKCGMTYDGGDEYFLHTCVDYEDGPAYVYCDECGGVYMEGSQYDSHICYPAQMENDPYIYCDRCASFYYAGEEFNNHVCVEEQGVYCSLCDSWYKAGEAYANHDGAGVSQYAEFIQCPICGRSFVKGNDYNTHSCFAPQYVYCDVCGGYYQEGIEYRSHICVPEPDPNQTAIGTLYVDTANGGNLRMRARPDTNAAEVTSLKNGTAVTLFSYVNSQWAYVSYRSYFGYCMVRHLSITPPGAKPTPTATPASPSPAQQNLYAGFYSDTYWALVNPSVPTGFVNLRWAPTLDSPVQAIYYANTPLRVLATNGTWCQVIDDQNNRSGFMMSNYMKRLLY